MFFQVVNDPARRAMYLENYRVGLDFTNGGAFKALGMPPETLLAQAGLGS